MRNLFSVVMTILLATAVAAQARSRQIEATYIGTIGSIPEGTRQLDLWIPLPAENSSQSIRAIKVESPIPMKVNHDNDFGNAFLYGRIIAPQEKQLSIKIHFRVERREITNPLLMPVAWDPAPQTMERFLKPDRLVTISPRIWSLSDKLTKNLKTNQEKARAIYDYVVNNMTYDKTVPGWGKGDTERACDIKKGNCTDFHSLFISLARASGIPARFVIGFPLNEAPTGTIQGYHCWADFYLPGHGWVPVDASEASRSSDPKRRNYLFSNLDPDRIEFTVGRDIRLNPPQAGEPLNYFIYPYAEADGKPIADTKIQLDYKDIPSVTLAKTGQEP